MFDHAVIICVLYWIFSAVVGGMPLPGPSSKIIYQWAFQSFHILAGNITVAFASRFPQFTVPDGATAIHKETTVVVQPPTSS